MFSVILSKRGLVSIILTAIVAFTVSPSRALAQSMEVQGSVQSIPPGDTALKYVVSGPASASSSSGAFAIFDGDTGVLIKRATNGARYAGMDSDNNLYLPVTSGRGLILWDSQTYSWRARLLNYAPTGALFKLYNSSGTDTAAIYAAPSGAIQGWFTAGNMGFGTISPSSKTDVVTNVSGGYAAEFVNNGNNSDRYGIMVQAGADNGSGTNHMIRFYSGPDSGPAYRGSINVTGSTIQLNTTSDARLKTDIQNTLRQGMAMVKAVPVRDYVFIDSGAAHTGFIAQELETAYPEATSEDKDTRIVEHHTKRIIPAGVPYKDEVAPMDREVEEVTTETFTQTVKCIRPLMLIPILWKAVQEQDEAFLDEEEKNSNREARIAALEQSRDGLTKQVQDLATGVIRLEDLAPGAENTAVVMRLTESVLRQLGVDPWLEITLADAIETAPETVESSVTKAVTKYRLNLETAQAEAYTVEETVTEQTPTGKTVKRLKAGTRFDEATGKAYRWVGLSSADAAGKLTALRIAGQIASVQTNMRLAAKFVVPPSGSHQFVAPPSGGLGFVAPPSGGEKLVVPPLGGQELVAPPSGGVLSASASAATAKSKPAAR